MIQAYNMYNFHWYRYIYLAKYKYISGICLFPNESVQGMQLCGVIVNVEERIKAD